jgi:hypothetical protein
MSPFYKWERRDYKQKKKELPYLLLSILFFLFSLAFAADQIGLTNVAHAEKPHMTEKEVCQKMTTGYPVMADGVSDKELRDICARYGVKLSAVTHY